MAKKKNTNSKTVKNKKSAKETPKMEKDPQNEAAEEKVNKNDDTKSETAGNCQEDIEKLEAQVEALKDKHLRLFSEFDNFRKRNYKRKDRSVKFCPF
jgi:molecular chaperone GrpE